MSRINYVEYNGEKVSLHRLALIHGVSPSAVQHRYKRGVRGAEELVFGLTKDSVRGDLTPKEKAYLLDVAKYSEGQSDHWTIMCDFAGVSKNQLEWLKEQLS